jgi:hypothetical protein
MVGRCVGRLKSAGLESFAGEADDGSKLLVRSYSTNGVVKPLVF